MTQGGLIIRLIDIALIILFGFISISDIKVKAQIKLPTPMQEQTAKNEQLYVIVRINADNLFQIANTAESLHIETLPALEESLLSLRDDLLQKNQSLYVLIEPHEESAVQTTVYVMDICTRLNIAKNLAYDYGSLDL